MYILLLIVNWVKLFFSDEESPYHVGSAVSESLPLLEQIV